MGNVNLTPLHSLSLPSGLQTTEDAKFYALSTRFKPFSNENETLVVQFSVKHEQGIDCGGGYVKLFPASLNQDDMHAESQYYIMFGKLPGAAAPCPRGSEQEPLRWLESLDRPETCTSTAVCPLCSRSVHSPGKKTSLNPTVNINRPARWRSAWYWQVCSAWSHSPGLRKGTVQFSPPSPSLPPLPFPFPPYLPYHFPS